MTEAIGLEFSIPANNQKVIEIYNKIRGGQLMVNKDYQRKLVWKRTHKFNFIDTILKNFPFPEIYLAPGAMDQEKLILIDEIVDGQQRLATIQDYIEGKDVFALPGVPIPKFSELSLEQRKGFLNYEISVRYLKNVSPEQVREIFQRINKTDYALNATERLNAQWGNSEFVCFVKQLVDPNFDADGVQYILDENSKKHLVAFFHGEEDDEEGVFSESDLSRMYALQYLMALVATMDLQQYFARNERIKSYIQAYNDSFPQADDLKDRLLNVTKFIDSCKVPRTSRWYKKANLFSLIIELDKLDLDGVDSAVLGKALTELDHRASLYEIGLSDAATALTPEEERYFSYAREAVNQKTAREYRGAFLKNIIEGARKKS